MDVKAMGDYKEGGITLQKVLHVPSLKANLMSISSALENGVDKVVFEQNGVRIMKEGKTIATGSRDGLLFRLDIAPAAQQMDQASTDKPAQAKTPPKASYEI